MKKLLKNRDIYRAALNLEGKPIGGWGETRQAELQLWNELPRGIRLRDFIDAVFVEEHGRYRLRDTFLDSAPDAR